MAYTIELQTITDDSASLSVIEKILPFEIKRAYYLYNISEDAVRGRHGHRKAKSALISLNGTCEVNVIGFRKQCFILDTILLVLSSEHYDPEDYIYKKPR